MVDALHQRPMSPALPDARGRTEPAALVLDLPLERYLSELPALNRSTLARRPGRPRPRAAKLAMQAGIGTPAEPAAPLTPALAADPPLGQRVHDAALLDEAPPGWQALTGTVRGEAAASAPHEHDALRALLAGEAFRRSPWGVVLARGLAEITLVYRDAASGLWVKARPDLLDPATSTIWELKTVPRHVREAAVAFLAQPRNVLQAAVYRAALQAATGRPWRFGWLVLEIDAPRRIEPYDLPRHLQRQGEWMLRDALAATAAAGTAAPFDPAHWQAWSLDAPRRQRLVGPTGSFGAAGPVEPG